MVFAMGLPSWGEALSDDVIRRFWGSIGLRKIGPVQLGLDYSIESTYDIFFQRFSRKKFQAEVFSPLGLGLRGYRWMRSG
jgi:hypothetical protein